MTQQQYLLSFLEYFGTGALLIVIGAVVFTYTTRHREFDLMKQGNASAAIVLLGKLGGLVLVVGGAAKNAVSYTDFLLWGVIGLVTQIVAYFVIDLLTPMFKVDAEIQKKNIAVALFVAGLQLIVGYLINACMTL